MLELPPLTALQMSFVTIHKYILRVLASVLISLLQRLLDLARRVNWSSHCSPPPPSWNWLALHFVPPRGDTPQILRRRRERALKRPAIPEIEHFKLFYDAISTGVTEFWSPVNQSFLLHDACDDKSVNDVAIDDVDIDDSDNADVDLEMHKSHCL